MGLILDKQVLEKLEALQNVMLASVTGGVRDEDTYKQLREELFEVPSLKEALPRFVRTCASLSQLWHLIKSDNLPSYASRREYVWKAFRPLLSGIEEEPPTAREAFFAKGSDHDAYVHIRGILQLAKTKLLIIDPYMDSSIYDVLGTITAPLEINILTSRVPADFALEGRKFTKQHAHFSLCIRTTKDFHDRFIIADENKCYLLGASIKDAGNKSFTIVPLEDGATVTFLTNHAEQVWTAATVLPA